ncbi:MAG TPA: hypothetical protein VGV92_02215 [Gammaproteobacteria bacterium]|nr:hypothetical protein [Gammaproteobacteria bacterium]
MLKRILCVGVTGLVFVSAFAQQNETNSNGDKMQQIFNQAANQSSEQFNKNFAPSIQVPAGKAPPPSTTQQTPPSPPPMTYPEQPSSAQPSPKVPDVAVNPSDKSSDSSVGNMYAPGGNTQDSSNSSVNPYR